MNKCNHSNILKNILSIFHDTVEFTEIELQGFYQYLFEGGEISGTEDVLETLQYLKDIITDHQVKTVGELEQYFSKKEASMKGFIENVMEKLNDKERENTRIINAGRELYSIDKNASFLLDYSQRVNDGCAYPVTHPIIQTVAHAAQWTERIVIINTVKIYLFYFREYYFLQFEFGDCLGLISPFEFIQRIPVMMMKAFQRMSVMDYFVDNQRWNLMNNSYKEQPVLQRGKINRKTKICKPSKTPLEETISAIIKDAIYDFHASQHSNKEPYIDKYVGIEERKLSHPWISINR